MMRVSKMRGWIGGAVMSMLGVGALGCGEGTVDEEPAATQDALTVDIYWTATDQNNRDVIRSAKITKEQAAGIFAARAAARLRLAKGGGDLKGGGDVALRTSALTQTSTDWATSCQFTNWFLVTSGANQTGSIFCAKSNGTPGGTPAMIPFVPAWYDRSDTWGTALCTGTSTCTTFLECGAYGAQVWQYSAAGSGGGNIAPPSSVRYIASLPLNGPC